MYNLYKVMIINEKFKACNIYLLIVWNKNKNFVIISENPFKKC